MEGPHGEKLSENTVGMKSQPKNFFKRKLAVKEHIIQNRSKKNQWGYLHCEVPSSLKVQVLPIRGRIT